MNTHMNLKVTDRPFAGCKTAAGIKYFGGNQGNQDVCHVCMFLMYLCILYVHMHINTIIQKRIILSKLR